MRNFLEGIRYVITLFFANCYLLKVIFGNWILKLKISLRLCKSTLFVFNIKRNTILEFQIYCLNKYHI